jgi:aldehyde:ferredoxin oxidoreductase
VIRDSAVLCAFGEDDYVTESVIEALLDADYESLLAVGDRVIELERQFNNRRGMDRADDRLPYELPGFEAALEEYYALRDWNADGTVPDGRVTGATVDRDPDPDPGAGGADAPADD